MFLIVLFSLFFYSSFCLFATFDIISVLHLCETFFCHSHCRCAGADDDDAVEQVCEQIHENINMLTQILNTKYAYLVMCLKCHIYMHVEIKPLRNS